MNISLPEFRKDQGRQHLRGLLLEGAMSPRADTADADYFDRLRGRVPVRARVPGRR